MKKYTVGIMEVHVSHREVWADSEEEAKNLASALGAEVEVFCEYSHTLGEDTWTVKQEEC